MSLTETPIRERRYPLRADVRLSSLSGDTLAEVVMTDISAHGMGSDGLIHFAPDSVVCVSFPDGTTRTGAAMWHDAFWSGIRFDTPFDPVELDRLIGALESAPHFPRRAA